MAVPERERIDDLIGRLRDSMQTFAAAAREFPAGHVHAKPDPVAFSATEIVYHLVDVESLWQTRIAAMRGDEQVQFVRYDPDAHARTGNFNVRPYAGGIDEFIAARRHTFDIVRGISEERLGWNALHPKFGEVTVARILEIMREHDAGHTAQLERTKQALAL